MIPFYEFSSVAQSCPTLGNPMDYSTPGFPVHHQLSELTQTHAHQVGNAVQPSHMLSSPFPAFSLSQVLSKESVLHISWAKYWSFSFSICPSVNIQDWFPLGWTGWISLQSNRLSRVFSSTTIQKHQFFSAQPSLWSNSLSVHDYLKNHSFDYNDLIVGFLIHCLGLS